MAKPVGLTRVGAILTQVMGVGEDKHNEFDESMWKCNHVALSLLGWECHEKQFSSNAYMCTSITALDNLLRDVNSLHNGPEAPFSNMV